VHGFLWHENALLSSEMHLWPRAREVTRRHRSKLPEREVPHDDMMARQYIVGHAHLTDSASGFEPWRARRMRILEAVSKNAVLVCAVGWE
jgi:hypothetical protein